MTRSSLILLAALAGLALACGPAWFVNGKAGAADAASQGTGSAVATAVDPCTEGQAHSPDQCPTLDDDRDGVANGVDRCPLLPGSPEFQGCPPEERATAAKLSFKEVVYFESGKKDLRPTAAGTLEDVAATLKAHPEIEKVVITGHTDATGGEKFNQALAQARADAVRDYLVGQGVAVSRLEAKGYGEESPAADNKTRAGREKNRRVEVVVP